MQQVNSEIKSAYDSAIGFAKTHYENFPVVSLLVPKELRKHIAIIYWFARTADDIADEGNITEAERLNRLNEVEESFNASFNGKFDSPFNHALHQSIMEKQLTPKLFLDLLQAFKQDVVKKRYMDFQEVLGYCQNSANPVGRLILELFDVRNSEAFDYSDKICTALQLTNFYQDIEIDYDNERIYFPEDEMKAFNVNEKLFALKENNVNLKQLLQYNIQRTQEMFDEGKNLLKYLDGRLKLEIKWTILGGEAVLQKIRDNDYKIFNSRPKLTKKDFSLLLIKSFFT